MSRTIATAHSREDAKKQVANFEGGVLPRSLNSFIALAHNVSVASGWWHDINTGELLFRNRAELLMLMVSEIAEAMEGERKQLMDDKLPHRSMAEVELADACIRIFDYASACGYDLEGAIIEKTQFNLQREDHKDEVRKQKGGKAF